MISVVYFRSIKLAYHKLSGAELYIGVDANVCDSVDFNLDLLSFFASGFSIYPIIANKNFTLEFSTLQYIKLI